MLQVFKGKGERKSVKHSLRLNLERQINWEQLKSCEVHASEINI